MKPPRYSKASTLEILALVVAVGTLAAVVGTSILTALERSMCDTEWTVEQGCKE